MKQDVNPTGVTRAPTLEGAEMTVETSLYVTAPERDTCAAARPRGLIAFAAMFGVALMSGLFYYLVPHDLNWHVSQASLLLHLATGTVAVVAFTTYVVAHQREQEGRSLLLIAPWLAIRRTEGETRWRHRQRLWGYALTWTTMLVVTSGVLVSLPGMLWFADVIWLPGYLMVRSGNAVHLVLSLAGVGLIWVHWSMRGGRPGRRGGVQ